MTRIVLYYYVFIFGLIVIPNTIIGVMSRIFFWGWVELLKSYNLHHYLKTQCRYKTYFYWNRWLTDSSDVVWASNIILSACPWLQSLPCNYYNAYCVSNELNSLFSNHFESPPHLYSKQGQFAPKSVLKVNRENKV